MSTASGEQRLGSRRRSVPALAVLTGFFLAVAVMSAAQAAVTPIDPYDVPPGGTTIETQVMMLGPFDLAPSGSPGWDSEGNEAIPRPPGGYGIKTITFDIVDADGNPVPRDQAHLHHFVAAQVGKADPLCDRKFGSIPLQPIFGTGAERTAYAFPDGYALLSPNGSIWGATWHIMNLTDSPRQVYIQYTLGLQRDATIFNTRPLDPYFLDVTRRGTSCGSASFDVAGDGGPGSTVTESQEYTIDEGGILIGAGGHLHDGGITTDLTDETGAMVCHSDAVYGDGHGHGHSARSHLGSIWAINPCPLHDEFPDGQRFTLDAVYDNSEPYDDVMGIMMLYVWHGTQPPAPTTTTAPPTTSTTTTDAAGDTTTTVDGLSLGPTPTTAAPSTDDGSEVQGAGAAQPIAAAAAYAG